eukprot:gene7904-8758_t
MEHSKNSVHVEKMSADMASEFCDFEAHGKCGRFSRSSLVVRHVLSPLDWLMKVTGMTYGSSCPLQTDITKSYKVQRVYTVAMMIYMSLITLRLISFLFIPEEKEQIPTFIRIEYIVWFFKCTVQHFFCVFICTRKGRKISRLQTLISEFDCLLLSYNKSDRKAEQKFTKRCRIILGLLVLVMLTTFGIMGFTFFSPNFEKIQGQFILPFKVNALTRTIFMLTSMYFSVAWLLPVILYCILCLALCLTFDQFGSSLSHVKCTSVKARIGYIREEYMKLQKISSCTDNVIGLMALFVYFFDVVLFCFHLYHAIYYATNTAERIPPIFMTFVSVCNLFCVSLSASKVVDKGQDIYSFISKMNTCDISLESHAQVTLSNVVAMATTL